MPLCQRSSGQIDYPLLGFESWPKDALRMLKSIRCYGEQTRLLMLSLMDTVVIHAPEKELEDLWAMNLSFATIEDIIGTAGNSLLVSALVRGKQFFKFLMDKFKITRADLPLEVKLDLFRVPKYSIKDVAVLIGY